MDIMAGTSGSPTWLSACASKARLLVPLARLLLALVLLPVVLVLLVPVVLYKLLVHLVMLCRFGRHDARFMSSLDTGFSRELPQCRSIINNLLVLEGTMTLQTLRKGFQDRYLHKHLDEGGDTKLAAARGRKYGYWFWMRNGSNQVNIEEHIRTPEGLDSSGLVTEAQMLDMLSLVANTPFPKGRPAWEMLFLPTFLYDHEVRSTEELTVKRCAVIVRIHHSYGDGISLLSTVMSALADEPIQVVLPPAPRRTLLQNVGLALWALSYVPKNLVQSFTEEKNALRGARQLSGDKVLAWSHPVHMALLKNIKGATGATITDVLLSSVSECLYQHFAGCTEARAVPDYVNAVIPVPMKIPTKESADQLKNHVSPLLLRLSTGAMSPLERLAATQQETRKQKKKPNAYTNYWTIRFLLKLLPEQLTQLLSDRVPSTLVLSNMPGPQEAPFILGAKLVDFMFWVPNKGDIGVGVSLMSLAGRIRMGLFVDRALIPDRDRIQGILSDWEEQLHNLDKAATAAEAQTRLNHVTVFN